MTTELTKAQLATILAALDDQPRSPANRQAALKAIAKCAGRYGLTAEDVLGAAPGLLDERLSPEAFRAELAELADRPAPGDNAVPEAQEPDPAEETAAAEEPAPEAGNGAAVAAPDEPAATPVIRAGTKQALMIDLLKRPKGATIEQIAAATGWQRHSIRGAMSGALKKKLGLTIEVTRTREVGPNQTGARGSATVYRIIA